MTDLELTPLEQHILDASSKPEITQRRKRIVILSASTLLTAIIGAALLPVSRTFFVAAFAAYVLITLAEKVAYANAVLGYKSLIQKLLARSSPPQGTAPSSTHAA
jgi:hypothetical protein